MLQGGMNPETATPSSSSSSKAITKEDVKLTGSDIISAKSPSAILATRSNISNKDLLIGLLIVGISFLLFISVIVYQYFLSNEEILRQRKVRREASKNFNSSSK